MDCLRQPVYQSMGDLVDIGTGITNCELWVTCKVLTGIRLLSFLKWQSSDLVAAVELGVRDMHAILFDCLFLTDRW